MPAKRGPVVLTKETGSATRIILHYDHRGGSEDAGQRRGCPV
jgi:hypothetical protein